MFKKLLHAMECALLLGLLICATPADAQPVLSNLPSGTVVGRLLTGSGPAQAIPLATLSNNLSLFSSGKPWCDVTAQGAQGDGITDDTTATTKCRDTLAALGGGTMYFPPGNYCLKANGGTVALDETALGGTVTIRHVGAGAYSTVVESCGADVTVFKLGTTNSTIENMIVSGKGISWGPSGAGSFAAGFNQNAVVIAAGCVRCAILNTNVFGGSVPVFNQAADFRIDAAFLDQGYGIATGLWIQSASNISAHLKRTQIDHGLPSGCPTPAFGTSYSAWAAATAYSVGSIVTQGGYHICAISTTGDNKSGASFPGLNNYLTNIVDNHVTWQLVGATGNYGLLLDTGAFEINITGGGDFSGPWAQAAIGMVNQLAGQAPGYVQIEGATISNVLGNYAINASAGAHLAIVNSHILGCVATGCPVINIGASFQADVQLSNNIIGGGSVGILTNGPVPRIAISNNSFGQSGLASGVNIAAGTTNFSIVGNTMTGLSNIGVIINAGASDYYEIIGNSCGTGFTCVSDAGTGTHKTVDNGGAWTWSQPASFAFGSNRNILINPNLNNQFGIDIEGSWSSAGLRIINGAGTGVQFAQTSAAGPAIIFNSDNSTLGLGANNHTNDWTIGTSHGLYSLNATGGDQGVDTINAVDYFKNGTKIGETASAPITLSGGAIGVSLDATLRNNGGSLGLVVPVTLASGGTNSTAGVIAASVSTANPPYGFDACVNLQLNVTVSGNALTVAIKGNNGSDPSASNPVLCPFHDSTETSGDPVWRTLTAATSFATGTSGSTFGTSNGVASRFWIVGVDNGSTFDIGVVNLSGNGTQVLPLNEAVLQTTTACNACTNATTQGTIYTTTARSSKPIRILGYFEATEATAGTWASAPTRIKLFGPGVKKPGDIVQIIYASTTSTTTTTSSTFAATNLSQSISPTSAINLVIARAMATALNTNGATTNIDTTLRRGASTNIGGGAQLGVGTGTLRSFIANEALDNPATTSATTYAVYVLSQDNTTSVSYCSNATGNTACTLILEEIMGALEPANDNSEPLRLVG